MKRGHAFECLACSFEWRWRLLAIPKNPRELVGWSWPDSSCPACGSLYFEWLSCDVEPEDVYLNAELDRRAHHARIKAALTLRELPRGSVSYGLR